MVSFSSNFQLLRVPYPSRYKLNFKNSYLFLKYIFCVYLQCIDIKIPIRFVY